MKLFVVDTVILVGLYSAIAQEPVVTDTADAINLKMVVFGPVPLRNITDVGVILSLCPPILTSSTVFRVPCLLDNLCENNQYW